MGRRHAPWREGLWVTVPIAVGTMMGILMAPSSPCAASEAATVRRDGVRVYAEMTTASKVIKSLKKGESVTVAFALTSAEGVWCHIAVGTAPEGAGYVRCEDLDRDVPTRWREAPAASPPPQPRAGIPSPADAARDPLFQAASQGDTAAVRALLEHGAGQDAKDAALRMATIRGHAETVLALAAGGARVDSLDINEQTPLVLAANRGDLRTVQALLAAGAAVNARTVFGGTALMNAALWGHAETVEALLAAGADVNARDKKGQSALMIAASHAGRAHTPGKKTSHPATIQALLARGADVSARDDNGRTALILASANGNTAAVRSLLAGGADVHARDKYGGSALREASEGGHSIVVQMLKGAGARE